MFSDLKFAYLQLRKNRGSTAIAVLTMALGIGACTAVFSVLNTAVLHPFSYFRPDRLVVVHETFLPKYPSLPVRPGVYSEYKRQATVFTGLAAAYSRGQNLIIAGNPVRAYPEHVTANFFPTLGVQPILGRNFRPEEEIPGKNNVVILSYCLWQDNFAGRPDAIGQTVLFDEQEVTVIRVMPADFQYNS